jgi:hypothetical protein
MLKEDKIIAIFCMVDDMLKACGHREDVRARVSDSEVVTTAIISALYFGGHQHNAIGFVRMSRLMPHMLDKSRFCRRLHRLGALIFNMFLQLGQHLKDMAGAAEYVVDSFPVAVCDNIRIANSRILKGKQWRGRQSSMRRYFYGVKVQVLTTASGIPVEFCFVPGCESDVRALGKMPLAVAPESSIYADSAYTDYGVEDDLMDAELIRMMVCRKSNSKRKDQPWITFLKDSMRKRIETTFSEIKALFLKKIHAVTFSGFLLKITLFVFALTLKKVTE